MTYQEAIEYIHSLEVFGSKLGLERIDALLTALGSPHKQLKFVHIAGTNGKGSTACMTASVLRQAGYKTGLYISPYVVEFCERMQINGQMIPRPQLAALVQQVKKVGDTLGLDITEFEFITAAAFLWFMQSGCQIVVLEVGLGGRFDATNCIPAPLVAAITAIDLDHTQILGDNIAAITGEKCGIIKKGCQVVSYPSQHPEALAIILEHCANIGASLYMGNLAAAQVQRLDITGSRICYKNLTLEIPLIGAHQIANTLTTLEILARLRDNGFAIADADISAGIGGARFPSRMEKLGDNPLIFLDGAHNLAGAKALGSALKLLEGKRIIAVAGMLADKDWAGALAQVAPHLHRLFTAAPQNPRALDSSLLAEHGARYCTTTACNTPEEAWAQAKAMAKPEDVLLVWGSLYLSAQLREIILQEQ